MRQVAVPLLLLVAVWLAPVRVAEARCWPVPGCYLTPSTALQLDGKVPKIVGAAAAVGLAAGLAAYMARADAAAEAPLPDGVVEVIDEDGNRRLGLQLIPTAPPEPYVPYEARPRRHDVFRLNDVATTTIILVGGAAILTSVIVGFARR